MKRHCSNKKRQRLVLAHLQIDSKIEDMEQRMEMAGQVVEIMIIRDQEEEVAAAEMMTMTAIMIDVADRTVTIGAPTEETRVRKVKIIR